MAAESLKENCIDGISWILGSLPSIGAQYSQYTKSDKVIIPIFRIYMIVYNQRTADSFKNKVTKLIHSKWKVPLQY